MGKRKVQEFVFKKLKHEFKDIVEEGVCISDGIISDKVWVLWLQGIDNAPKIVKACMNSLKEQLSDKEIIVLSEGNLHQYVKFPKYIVEKYKKGVISRTHYSDLIRIFLLAEYGGIWIDSTVLCTDSGFLKTMEENPLFVYRTTADDAFPPIIASSWMISARSHHPILMLTQKILWAYWERYNFLMNYFLFHLCFSIAAERYADEWKKVPFYSNSQPHALQWELGNAYSETRWRELTAESSFHKLTVYASYEQNKGNFYNYILNRYL